MIVMSREDQASVNQYSRHDNSPLGYTWQYSLYQTVVMN